MSVPTWVIEFTGGGSAQIASLGLGAAALLMVVLTDRPLAVGLLLLQYVLLAWLLAEQLLPAITLVRLGQGLAISLILLLPSGRTRQISGHTGLPNGERAGARHGRRLWDASERLAAWTGTNPSAERTDPMRLSGIYAEGLPMRLAAAVLAMLLASGLARTYPLPVLRGELVWVSYWVMCCGLVALLIGRRPLRIGLALLTLMNGFEALYLSLEKSLLVMGLLGIVHILLALVVSLRTEGWADLLQGESALR
ncbi:MAG: hypothetical protein FJZ90_15230 [Chloroflexi bacterium]|nr:hypothetical protein [Chloroflexota bacterium]